MRVEIDHACGRVHHSFAGLAACAWPEAGYVIGDGSFALIAHCDLETVHLYPTPEAARQHCAELDAHGCGRRCHGDHEVVALVPQRVGAG